MEIFRQGMKGPTRPAPSVPGFGVNRYSPVTNWNDDPFGADVFEPMPHYTQKKKPPPRPPPPKIQQKHPDIPVKPSYFVRKPTVLSSLLARKGKVTNTQMSNTEIYDIDTNKMFPKCDVKNIQTGALIDLSSPPSSPTFTTRSSSDGLSVDSFGSDATSSTNHHNQLNGGSTSQAESGFEDDFDFIGNHKKGMSKDDTFDDFHNIDPFSPQPVNKPPLLRKPELTNGKITMNIQTHKVPTIIRAKPARPKPPDNSALLRSTFLSMPTVMNVNTTMPIHKVNTGFGDNFDTKPLSWDEDISIERESSPPMPSIPPPPPPAIEEEDWPVHTNQYISNEPSVTNGINYQEEEPYAIALYDYSTGHPEDLCFSVNMKINLIRRVNNEWLYGRLRNGSQGLFPANFVEIKVPLPSEQLPVTTILGVATALYDFQPAHPGDLRLAVGDQINIINKLNNEWYYGECKGLKGQFPSNYVQIN